MKLAVGWLPGLEWRVTQTLTLGNDNDDGGQFERPLTPQCITVGISMIQPSRSKRRLFGDCLTGLFFSAAAVGMAQDMVIQTPNGPVTVNTSEGGVVAFPPGMPPGADGAAPTASDQGKDKTKNDESDESKSESKDNKSKDDEKPDSIKRPTTPPRVPDPREFDVRPDKNSLVTFTFIGQPWPDVLQWLAIVSGRSLDWQELPNDYINFSIERPHSIPEVLDLFNRLLFDRGYTMVLRGEVMSIFKIKNLDPSLLRRVEDESELMDLPAHNFVKMTFQLPDQLKADKAAEDVKSLLSSHAKVQPLMATNRLLVIDIVANQREVSRLINSEHAGATGKVVPREFVMRYARADQVADQVMVLLGLDPSSRRTPQELQIEQQRLQLFTQMQQKGKEISKFLGKGPNESVFLAVNHRNNSIVVNAPPAEMGVVERAVIMLDVPSGSFAGVEAGSHQLFLRKYQLATIDPQAVVSALEELGFLHPGTQLKMDVKSKTIFASATVDDHEKISSMIDKLDGTGRQFEVIWLRRLPADSVAATIHGLMVGKEEKKDNSRRRSFFYSFYDQGREQEDDDKKFRVDADVENNRLLLWANEDELVEVRRFLVKLGELPGESGNPHTIRVLDARDKDATLRLIQQIRAAWPEIAPNELRIDGPDASAPPAASPAAAPDPSAAPIPSDFGQRTTTPAVYLAQYKQTQNVTPGKAEVPAINLNRPAPVTMTIQDDGRIMLQSDDTAALDRLEDLMNQLAPPPKAYKVFFLKYALAGLVKLNLDEYFAEEGEFDTEDNWWRAWQGLDFEKQEDNGRGLAKRRPLRFITDPDTNSILVTNASPQQLRTVEELIEIYDRPPAEDSISARRFRIFKLRYARAAAVAKTIKEVYRDLLSAKDREFANSGEKQQASQTTNYYRVFGSSDENEKPKKIKTSFAGALSVGADEVSNTLIVSAQEEWMSSIAEMVEYLDAEAGPFVPTVQVVSPGVSAEVLRDALARAFGDNSAEAKNAKGNGTESTTPAANKADTPPVITTP